jgi:hypothetical protein
MNNMFDEVIGGSALVPHTAHEIAPATRKPEWGVAHERRGFKYHGVASDLVSKFPVGTVLTNDQLDGYLIEADQLPQPISADTTSDAWMAHTHRRSRVVKCINKAGAHSRMTDQGFTPFVLRTIGAERWEVTAPADAALKSRVVERASSVIKTGRKQLDYVMQALEHESLPEPVKDILGQHYQAVLDSEEALALQARQHERKAVSLLATAQKYLPQEN